jgi:hypothetical protein
MKEDDINEGFWVFVSHSTKDFERVRLVRNALEDSGFRPILFYLKCLENENEVNDLLKREIDARKRFILCDSPNAQASKHVTSELQYAMANGAKMLVLLLDVYAREHYKNMFPLAQNIPEDDLIDREQTSIKVRDLTIAKTKEELVDLAVEKIVDRAFAPWTTYTMAKNMLEGIDCPKDEEEANRLFRIVYRKVDALDTIGYPGGTLFLARCEANGYGTKKDLYGALLDYQCYIRTCGSNDKIDREIEAIKREIVEQEQQE